MSGRKGGVDGGGGGDRSVGGGLSIVYPHLSNPVPVRRYADGNMSLGSKLSITDWRPIHSRGSCGTVCPVAGMPSLAAIHAHGSRVFLVAVIAALLLHLDLWQSLVWSTLVYIYGHGSWQQQAGETHLTEAASHPILRLLTAPAVPLCRSTAQIYSSSLGVSCSVFHVKSNDRFSTVMRAPWKE